ncbi:hypothetical protein [Hyalangium versicolor]|uniref:hypothetical protein n=1 Tax=Hyalangium versicolor TaxID=2861190 RepID=UPI001CCA7257|nr:hypothetical protein [Hyalangium versicolor]
MKNFVAALALVAATAAFAGEDTKAEAKPAPTTETKPAEGAKAEAKPEHKDGKKAEAPKTAAETK